MWREGNLPVYISTMADVEHCHSKPLVVNLIDNPKIADAEPPAIAPC
jgi:hypothetical protein